MTDIVSGASSIFGAVAGPVAAGQVTKGHIRWARRHASGTALLESLLSVKRLLDHRDVVTDVERWKMAIEGAITTIEQEQSGLPRQWAHLERSVRAAISEATGLGFADRMSDDQCWRVVGFDRLWLDFAAEYLRLVIATIGLWREEPSFRRANQVTIPSFDRWLQESGRYVPGLGLWPDESSLKPQRRERSILP
ncbi:hypothetical protein [Agromyces mariniharenae]|uniref:Uncharacterized protein n=1 Tax=Agromyces mariniharenae TaxID=2604423 RepID=A0A5S4UXM5_9MICO|nr:hypothetical protein [Agromyces mariniharenae]TYL50439.1 hypothetical protein FYC51_14625 [Agromyces mariniharenae]